MPVPTWRLAAVVAGAALVILAVPVDAVTAFVVVDVAIMVAAVVDLVLATAPARIVVERDLPGVLALETVGAVTWRVHNPTTRAQRVHLADELAPSLRPTNRRAHVRVPARGAVAASTALRPGRRGLFRPTELAVRVEGPLGLMARQRRRLLPGELRVYPPFRSKKEAELRIDRARILEVGLRSAQGRGGGTEFEQLREYTPDDEFRRMDWAATARTGRAIVRTYRAERNQTVIVMLDNGRVMAGRAGGVPRVEHAMDAVMMLTAVASRLGDRAGLVAFDRRVRAIVPPAPGGHQLTAVTEAMYRLEPELAESDYRGAFTQTLARFRKRSLLVVLTELAAEAVNETLVPALPLVLRHHLVVVGAVTDPDVVHWSRATPTDAGGSYRKAAAIAAIDERHRLAARLRGLGATVVDAPPGALAPRLADAYLRLKAIGRL